MKTLPPTTEAAAWFQILHPDGDLSPAPARANLRLTFSEKVRASLHALSAKARAGTLTPEEEIMMDNYERVGAILSTLKSKARQVLKKAKVNP
jgi:hypothetical protein